MGAWYKAFYGHLWITLRIKESGQINFFIPLNKTLKDRSPKNEHWHLLYIPSWWIFSLEPVWARSHLDISTVHHSSPMNVHYSDVWFREWNVICMFVFPHKTTDEYGQNRMNYLFTNRTDLVLDCNSYSSPWKCIESLNNYNFVEKRASRKMYYFSGPEMQVSVWLWERHVGE